MPALARTLSRFVGWWRGELATLVPQALRQWWQGTDGVLLLTFDGDRAIFERSILAGRREEVLSIETGVDSTGNRRLQIEQQLARAAGTNYRLFLGLPPTTVLRRTLTLPLAVEENLRQTLGFELDRYTPFKPDQVYFDYRLLERDPVQRRIKVELAVVERSVVDQQAARVATLGLPVAGAALADQVNPKGALYNFLPAMPGSHKRSSRTFWRTGLSVLVALLLATLLAIPVWQKRAAAISLLGPLATAKAAAQETDVLRDRLDKVVKEYDFLLDMKWGSPSALLILEELSKLLPDDAFIVQLEFDGKIIQIQGESASASSLVEFLERSPMFKDVGFKAQLTKIQGTPNDRFHIVAAIEDARPSPSIVANGTASSGPATSSTEAPAAPTRLAPANTP
jgi:general secretion pathway protein L